MILILTAAEMEIRSLKRASRAKKVRGTGKFRIFNGNYFDNELMVVVTGMGKQNAVEASQLAFENYEFDAVINVGFAGAIRSGLKIGDVVICRSCGIAGDPEVSSRMAANTVKSDEHLLQAVRRLKDYDRKLMEGDCLTVPWIVTESAEKRKLGRSSDADVVDVEGYWFAEAADRQRLPFVAIKSISDTLEEEIPDFNFLLEGNIPLLQKFISYASILLRPSGFRAVLRMYKNCAKAEKNLADLLCSLISGTGVV